MKTENIVGKKRIAGLDLVRCVAIGTVVGGHFFMNTRFGSENFAGVSMFLQAMVRQVMVIGVPLFLMLTGYLNANKKLSRSYYRGLIRVLVAYVVYSVMAICFREFYLADHKSALQWVHAVFRFDAIPYAWYIEMWIGLFLLTPFLNAMYKVVPTKRQKQALILTLLFLTLIPLFTNRYGLKVLPEFWKNMHPLVYFFAGLYIREYRPKIKVTTGVLIILGIALLNPLFNILLVHDRPMLQPFGGTETPFTLVVAVCMFLMLYERDVKGEFMKRALAKVSLLSLDMYLVSYMFDALFYPLFMERFFHSQAQFGLWWFVLVPLILLCSFILSALVNPLLPTGKKKQPLTI